MSKEDQLEKNKQFFAELVAIDRHAIVEKIKALKGAIETLKGTPDGVPQKLLDQLEHWEEELKKFN